jgi:hypothetical protein
MTMKKGLRQAMAAVRPNKQQVKLLLMYSAGHHAPTPYMTKALAKARRRNRLARRARRRNR